MAFDQTITGSIGPDNIFTATASNKSYLIQLLQGDDNLIIDGDVKLSAIFLDGGSDKLTITSTGTAAPTLLGSTINGGQGGDTFLIKSGIAANNFIYGDLGNDNIRLASVNTSAKNTNNASYTNTEIYGDTGVGTDRGGIDTVWVDNTVAVFNQSKIDLESNDNGFGGPISDNVIDLVTGFLDKKESALATVSKGLEGMLIQAGEVFESTFKGGEGRDWIIFDSLFSPFQGAAGTTALDTSVVSGNQGDDAIAILRNTDNSTINGGQGDDYLVAFSGVSLFTRYAGNRGADTMIIGALESQNSSFLGGQGDDTLNVGAVEATNSTFEGNIGDDKINFFAVQSTNSTLSGGAGSDEIDDFSGAIRFIGNVLDGGAGSDRIRQAANIPDGGTLAGILGFGSTIIGGTGADVMTGDSNTQTLGGKKASLDEKVDPMDPDTFTITGAGKDLFRFSFGDSVINDQGVGNDEITDFDSNASFYIGAAGDPLVAADYIFRPGDGVTAPLGTLQRDVIDLTDANITIGVSKTIDIGGGLTVDVNVNKAGLSDANNLTDFIQAGVLQKRGAAILFNENDAPFTPAVPFDTTQFTNTYLFISDGDQVLSDGDLLINLRNVAFDPNSVNAGMVLNGGDIVNFNFA